MNAHITSISEVKDGVITVSLRIRRPIMPLDPANDEEELGYLSETDIIRILSSPEKEKEKVFQDVLKKVGLPLQIKLTKRNKEVLEREMQYYKAMRVWEAKMEEYDTLHLGEAELMQEVEE